MRPSLNSLSSARSNQKTLHDPLGSCRRRADVVARLNAGCALRQTPPRRWAFAQHRTPFSQPGRTRRRATGRAGRRNRSRSWASSPRHRWRSRTGVCDQAGGRPSLSVEVHVRRAAARRLSSRRAASQRRGSGDHTPGRKCMCDCAGGAVLKKIAARFSFRGLRARKDTIAHATESHGVIRATVAVARRTGTQRACSVRAVRERVTSLLRRACSHRGCSRAAARKQEAPPNLG